MSLRQLRTRIEHLEAKSPDPVNDPVNNEERTPLARWEELRLRQWKQRNRPNEVEKPLTEEEEAEFKELTYRFHPLGRSLKAWEEASAEAEQRDRDRRRRPRPNEFLA